jgi:subtilisin family serine protease
MRARLVVAIFLSLSASARAGTIGPHVAARVAQSGRVRVIVALRDGPESRTATALSRLERSMKIGDRWERFGAFVADTDSAALAELEGDPDVLRVDLDSGGSGGDDASLGLIGGNIVRAMGYSGAGVTVAVLDSGIDETHPDLKAGIADEQCFCANADGTGCCPNRQTTQSGFGAAADEYGHGTNVAGIIASQGTIAPVGLAPGVRIVAVRVLDANNLFSGSSQVLSGMGWVLTKHPETRVVNMSLYTGALFTGTCDETTSFTIAYSRAIAALRANGTLVFACSGNSGSSVAIGAPACNQLAISVGAVYDTPIGPWSAFSCTDNTTAADQVTCFSNSNATLDLLGPGVRVTSTGLGSARSTYTGTSQATPHAAALAAILFGIDPTLTPDAVESILKNTGKPLLDPRNGVLTPRVDALAAVQWLKSTRPKKRAAKH